MANTDTAEKPTIRWGLEGVVVAETSVSTVGIPEIGLTYRGFAVPELIEKSSFEETALLLITGEKPSSDELTSFKKNIALGRDLSAGITSICESLPATSHPMCVVSACVSYYGAVSKTTTHSEMCAQLIGFVPSVLSYWYKFANEGVKIDTKASEDVSVAKHFLECFYGKKIHDISEKALASTLIAYAEHDLNASTFCARVTGSTLSDYYSCVVSAINTLKGPLHGGANEAALKMLKGFTSPDEVPDALTDMLNRKEKIMGFGHRVYKTGDPRSNIMKKICADLLASPDITNKDHKIYSIGEVFEREMITRKKIYPNLDFYASVVYHLLELPQEIYTVLFIMGRLPGWSAHIAEQAANNKLIRPKSYYVGSAVRPFK